MATYVYVTDLDEVTTLDDVDILMAVNIAANKSVRITKNNLLKQFSEEGQVESYFFSNM